MASRQEFDRVLVALTATPRPELLDVVKGIGSATLNDEGFLSWCHKGGPDFASVGSCDRFEVLQELLKVDVFDCFSIEIQVKRRARPKT